MRKKVLRIHKMITKGNALIFYRILSINFFCGYCRASDISRGRGCAKFRHFREKKNAKYREIHQKYFQIHVGKAYLIIILAIRPVLFTPNIQIYLETLSLQQVNYVSKLPGVFRLMLRKTGH